MKKEVKNEYAKIYIFSLDQVVDQDGMHGLVVQMKYIKENLRGWRGETAREVKEFLTNWIKEKEMEKEKENQRNAG
jgi:aconitase A